MQKIYVVTFYHADGGYPESYSYWNIEDAQYHKNLLEGDELYNKIEITEEIWN